MAASAAVANFQTAADPCQGLPQNHVIFGSKNALHASETTGERISMSYPAINRPLRERVKIALQRRLYPNTGLTQKVLARSVGLSDGTIANLLNGNNDPSGRVLDKLVAFFRDSFINEIWGAHNIHCIDTRMVEKALVVAQLVAAQAELKRLG